MAADVEEEPSARRRTRPAECLAVSRTRRHHTRPGPESPDEHAIRKAAPFRVLSLVALAVDLTK